jgi:hypothetical protein
MSLAETPARFRYLTSADRKKAFQKAIDADQDGKIFNDQFIDGLSRRLDAHIADKRRALIVQWAVLLGLAAALLSSHFTISTMGVSFDAKNAREFLLVISSSLLFFDVGFELHQSQCWELLEALLERRAGNNPLILKAVTLRYAYDDSVFILDQKGAQPGRLRAFLMRAVVNLMNSWNFIVSVVAVWVIQISAVVSILREPSFARWLSILIAGYVISIYIVVIGMKKILGTAKAMQHTPIMVSD